MAGADKGCTMNNAPSPYGAIGYHWKGRRWFINLYVWRRGPWRLSWHWRSFIGDLETPILNTVFSRAIADVLWGLQRTRQARGWRL